jgi:nicotinamidase/pyrazinamidase
MAQIMMWDIDTQIDFILPGKALSIEGAERILPNLAALTRYAREAGFRILGSEDWHSASDTEISERPDWSTTWPPHCMAGTQGQLRVLETRPADPLYIDSAPLSRGRLEEIVRGHPGEIYFRKQTVDVFEQPNVEPVLDVLGASMVVLYGVALDVCVRYAVEGFLRRGREELVLVSDATWPIEPDRGKRLLDAWADRGVRSLATGQVLEGALAAERVGSA